jgi:hypothetical protein
MVQKNKIVHTMSQKLRYDDQTPMRYAFHHYFMPLTLHLRKYL